MPERFVDVAVPLPVSGTFTYSVPEPLHDAVLPGLRVLVPFGRRKVTGFVVGVTDVTDVEHVRPIVDVIDVEPLVDETMLALTRWIADYYLASWGEVLRTALPPGINMESRRFVRITPAGREALEADDPAISEPGRRILEALVDRDEASLGIVHREAGIPRRANAEVVALRGEGLIEIVERVRAPRVDAVTEGAARLAVEATVALAEAETLEKRAPRQAGALRELAAAEEMTLSTAELAARGFAAGVCARLVERGLVERFERPRDRLSTGLEGWDLREEGALTPEQSRALELIRSRLDASGFGVVLLHGVTGSGKTRVYVEAVQAARAEGRGAIVLVPEIALTPQMVQRLRAEFGDEVAVVHSGLSLGERYDTWRAVRDGRLNVVVGPRSAVFAPVRNLGVIVVDEEHEGTYKQGESPRYHARDVAAMRAKIEGAVVILGTATPSLESYLNARDGKYDLVELPERIDSGPLPEVSVVDMRETTPVDSEGAFSAELRDAVQRTLDGGHQVILFLNRRGYASFIQCMDCGHAERCVDCNVSMTYHSTDRSMRCHYCGRTGRAPDRCPECDSPNLRYGAPGTQRVEMAVRELFPDAAVERMDQDTTGRHGSHWRILKDFAERRTDILLGTQMIAKGLDFPGVGLVGVVAADVGLNLPDFRSGERTFQLLTQVAGRTGRGGERGEVIVQTYLPDHYTIALARAQAFAPFFERETEERKGLGLGYPPFTRLVSIIVRGRDEQAVMKSAARLAEFLDRGAGQMEDPAPEVLGPAPAPLERIKGVYRWQILVRGRGGTARALVAGALAQERALGLPAAVRLAVDVDPMDLL